MTEPETLMGEAFAKFIQKLKNENERLENENAELKKQVEQLRERLINKEEAAGNC